MDPRRRLARKQRHIVVIEDQEDLCMGPFSSRHVNAMNFGSGSRTVLETRLRRFENVSLAPYKAVAG
jgi:hypothetical protein